jgi:hypothetical protein
MKANYELCLSGENVILVPYRPEHVPTYHDWMTDPKLLELTSSEPLTLDEEVRMQEEWHRDEGKCTFVILARDLLLHDVDIGDDDCVTVIGHGNEIRYSYEFIFIYEFICCASS